MWAVFRKPEVEKYLIGKLMSFFMRVISSFLIPQSWWPRESFLAEYVHILLQSEQKFSKVPSAFPDQNIKKQDMTIHNCILFSSSIFSTSGFRKTAYFRFRGSDRQWKSTQCNSPSQVVYAPKVSCKSVYSSRRRQLVTYKMQRI